MGGACCQSETNNNMYSKDIDGQFLYIRHAESVYNQAAGKNKSKDDPIRFEEQYMDAMLSETGKNQAMTVGRKLADLDVRYVFVSPIKRCLQTCLIALEGKIKEKGMKVFVHPMITEMISGVHDLSGSVKEKKEMTKGLCDWKYFDLFYDKDNDSTMDQQFYYFKYSDNQLVGGDVKKLMAQMKGETNPERNKGNYAKFVQSYWQQETPQRPETFNNLLKRAVDFKKFLKTFRKDMNLRENEKVLVFTHSYFIKMSTSKSALVTSDLKEFPSDAYYPDNCEVISMNIDAE